MLPGIAPSATRDQFVRSKDEGALLPSSDDDIAFAPVTQLSRWIESRKLTSERLTNIYLNRIERLDGKIRAIVTLTKEVTRSRAQSRPMQKSARQVSRPTARYSLRRQDLLDTKDSPTTYGAEPSATACRRPTQPSCAIWTKQGRCCGEALARRSRAQ